MVRLRNQEIETLRKRIVSHDYVCPDLQKIPARFEAPTGEWFSHLAGFLMGRKFTGQPLPPLAPITEKDSFNAQGLEGKMVFETCLNNAVVMASQCAPRRYAIYANRKEITKEEDIIAEAAAKRAEECVSQIIYGDKNFTTTHRLEKMGGSRNKEMTP